ncbi:hypothetical protein MesoLjLc_72750 [Mesorhizobium sp. L-8-10]|uniref:DUF4189 domain-containing protein n=1 Tax=Mesorhizobium sp. L-8-10 TaxID=2744523 RepID=UPI001926C1D9|nr:DUF4189 domain-containing protein [Mesorhizobium sp. L-8-10]BCH35345.1 hypothetical protein MesoLjLc_72750 [Mesorhizobium sp. L-8-10]
MKFRSTFATLGFLLAYTGQVASADLAVGISEAPVPPPQEERGIWAAIAYSDIDEKHGFFWGADKRQEAMDIAFEHCENAGGEACKVVEVFRNHRHWDDDDDTGFPYNHCGALAIGKEKLDRMSPWGVKSAPTRREAEDLAVQACETSGMECKVREWVCT